MPLFLFVLLILGIGVVLSLSLVIHELGHAVAARLAGLHVQQIILLNWRLDWTEEGWKCTRQRSWYSLVGLVRIREGKEAGWRYVLMILGGPGANLLSSLISMGTMLLVQWIVGSNPSVSVFLGINSLGLFALMNGLFALGTLIPGTTQSLRTDGGQLWDLFRAWLRRRRSG